MHVLTQFLCVRNLVSEDDCIKASLTEMKLEPADNDLDIPQVSGARKADKVDSFFFIFFFFTHSSSFWHFPDSRHPH